MAYDLYVTRREQWFDDFGPEISLAEWRGVVESDPELRFDESLGEHFAVWSGPSKHEIPWIAWERGNLESKHPDPPLIAKMVGLAGALSARVVGEEGERYGLSGLAEAPKPSGMLRTLVAALFNLFRRAPDGVEPSELPFTVDTRVRDFRGRLGTVTSINLKAENGLGVVIVRLDDGQTVQVSAVAHGLERLESSANGI
jgi:hypothetical protein